MRAEQIRELGDEMKEAMEGYSADVVMSALTLVTAEALASMDMLAGKTIDDAMALFTKQVRALYAELVSA